MISERQEGAVLGGTKKKARGLRLGPNPPLEEVEETIGSIVCVWPAFDRAVWIDWFQSSAAHVAPQYDPLHGIRGVAPISGAMPHAPGAPRTAAATMGCRKSRGF